MRKLLVEKVRFVFFSGLVSAIVLTVGCRSAESSASGTQVALNDFGNIDKVDDDSKIPFWPIFYHGGGVTSILWPVGVNIQKEIYLKINKKAELMLDKKSVNLASSSTHKFCKKNAINKYSDIEFKENLSSIKESYDIEIASKTYSSLPLLLNGGKKLVKSLAGNNRHTVVELFRLVKKWKADDSGRLKISSKDEKLFNEKAKSINFNHSIPQTGQQKEEICRNLIEQYTKLVNIEYMSSLLYSTNTYDKFNEWRLLGGFLAFHKDDGEVERNNLLFSLLYGSKVTKDSKKWHVLVFLADGEHEGDRDSFSFLEFLYRYKRDGNKSKSTLFPALTYTEDDDEKSKRFSFLWRVFNLESKNDKLSGHLLFIPFSV